MNDDLCPKDCKYLSISEEQQEIYRKINKVVLEHRCYKYDVKLYHMLAHPDLYKCEECYGDSVKNK